MNGKRSIYLLLIIAIFYFIICLLNYSEVNKGDETRYIMFAGNLYNGFYSPEKLNIWNGPGYPMVLTFMVPFGKKSMALLNPLFMIAGLVLFNKSVKRLNIGPSISNISTVVLALFPFMFKHLSVVMTECFTFFLICCVLYSSIQYLSDKKSRNLFLLSLSIAYLAITKVIFYYVIVFVLLLGIAVFFTKKEIGRSLYRIAAFSMLLSSPWLVYTYQLTGKIFYPSNAGGLSLYWMTTPYFNEYGDWHSTKYSKKSLSKYDEDWHQLYAEKLAANHLAITSKIENLPPLEKDMEYRREGLKNIRNAPLKYLKNIICNVGRMWFSVPFSYSPHKPSIIVRVLYMSFVLVFFVLSVVWIFYAKKHLIAINFILFLFIVYMALSSLVSAFNRMLDVTMPIVFLIIAFAVNSFKQNVQIKKVA